MLLRLLSFTAIFMLAALLILLTACLPLSRGLAAQDFLLTLILILSILLTQELTSIFTPSSLSLVNSGTLFLDLFSHFPTTWLLSREEYQDTLQTKLAILLISLQLLWGVAHCSGLFVTFFFVCPWPLSFLYIKKISLNFSALCISLLTPQSM